MSFIVPMYESERGWGAKVDGYTGPFESIEAADLYVKNYNLKYNNERIVPDYYIKALDPIPHRGQTCDYRLQEDLLQLSF